MCPIERQKTPGEAWETVTADREGPASSALVYGDGSDGDVTISVDTVLTRDMLYNNLTIDAGVALDSAAFRIFVRGTLLNNGTIRNNGADATDFNGAQNAQTGPLTNGGAGGNGVNAAVDVGLDGSGHPEHAAGGIGGAGGAANAETGGAAGPVGLSPEHGSIRWLLPALSGRLYGNSTSRIDGGSGGGGGGCDSATADSGGGGAGGPVIVIAARILDNSAGVIEANGGVGAAATGTGDAGGGGGGGGGYISLIYDSASFGIEQALGGSGGAGQGAGSDGADGAVGTILKLPNSM